MPGKINNGNEVDKIRREIQSEKSNLYCPCTMSCRLAAADATTKSRQLINLNPKSMCFD